MEEPMDYDEGMEDTPATCVHVSIVWWNRFKGTALEAKERGNEFYKRKDYQTAIEFYTKAIGW